VEEVGRLTVRLQSAAGSDIEDIGRFVGIRNPAAAARVVSAIRRACERLGDFPGIGRAGRHPGTREWAVGKTPYVIIYRRARDDADIVEILRIYHGRRAPQSIEIGED
jgi:toxin ParE1/3/4